MGQAPQCGCWCMHRHKTFRDLFMWLLGPIQRNDGVRAKSEIFQGLMTGTSCTVDLMYAQP